LHQNQTMNSTIEYTPVSFFRLFLQKVRDMDGLGYFDESSSPHMVVGGSGVAMANRGASGIDGVLSTALGYAVGSGHPVRVFRHEFASFSLFSLIACL